MFRGLLAFGLATCVVGAPLATDLCQAACAMRSEDATVGRVSADATGGRVLSDPPKPASEHHSCHAEAPPAGASVIAVHACGHTDELPGSDRPEHGTAVAIMPAAGTVAPAIDVARARIASVHPSPPLLTTRASQLRV